MSGESWLAMEDSSTHQSWVSRPGIQCFLFSSLIYLFFKFTFHFQFSISYLGCGKGAGAARFGPHYLIFDKLFNIFTFWRPPSLTSLCVQVFISGKTSLVPSF